MHRWQRKIVSAILTVLLLLLTSLAPIYAANTKEKSTQLTTTAESAVLMDANGTVLFEKDSHKRLPPASVTKIMTLLLAVEAVEQGKVSLTDEVSISENAYKQGGSQIWLEPGERMSLRELLIAIAVVSANDAAMAVMEHIYGSEQAGVEAMNRRAAELGLADTHFNSVNGLPAPEHYMSAYDTAIIAKEAVTHPLYLEFCGIKEYWLRGGKNWLVNTNKLLWWYKGADGLKTGWTEEAKYCFAGTAKRDGLRLISVVFATPEPRSHLRESMKLLDWGFANFSAAPIVTQGTVVEQAKVMKGVAKEVPLVAAKDLTLLMAKNKKSNIEKKVNIESDIMAPVKEGEKYGELIVTQDGQEIGKVDLVAEQAVEKAGFIRILQDMLTGLFTLG
ncbi:D-alanyl-D-alanine carboxypeptidase family protein [Propionispora hippei]|uniref:serine-type D-Ala-D-Ala carboxypeptidase n=1 Tax=Propionispora hippei DSM 15287 TaxID=1123003 RepID=A0A1M6AC01_9FIRM|nr:D-alanyl-D-alanine carboxypeptidase family protein [Propionispora hippei]SHI34016.1 D-alanyl-D-alanine carboxypeptidase (penicillin-binding protein 5/6) [Propionispora hippei DSM 15287]